MRSGLRNAALAALAAVNHGDQHHCPVCERNFARFMRRGINLMCVGCRSFARHRLMVLYLRCETELLRRPARVLHIAPEPGVHAVLTGAEALDNVTLDLEPGPDVQVQADARALPFKDACFDAVLCSHVLEHIPEDGTVAREIARVLSEDGIALIQVPVHHRLDTTYETFAPTPSDREREYGQDDHVRIYAADVENRLQEAFATVQRVDYAATFHASEQWRMGLVEGSQRRGEEIYVCSPAPPLRRSAVQGRQPLPGAADRRQELSASAASARHQGPQAAPPAVRSASSRSSAASASAAASGSPPRDSLIADRAEHPQRLGDPRMDASIKPADVDRRAGVRWTMTWRRWWPPVSHAGQAKNSPS
jgi:SAM-dependent methyltransferase